MPPRRELIEHYICKRDANTLKQQQQQNYKNKNNKNLQINHKNSGT